MSNAELLADMAALKKELQTIRNGLQDCEVKIGNLERGQGVVTKEISERSSDDITLEQHKQRWVQQMKDYERELDSLKRTIFNSL